MNEIIPVIDAFKEYTTFYSNMGADYSVTDILKPPRILHLMRRHRAELPPQDPSEIVESFMGSAIHNLFDFSLRKAKLRLKGERNYYVEQRLWDKFLDRKITGKFDVWLDEVLYDFKVTKTWKYIFGDFSDWEAQLNVYSYMAHLIGIETERVANIVLFKNFEKNKAWDRNYPPEQIIEMRQRHWSRDEQEAFLYGRIQALIDSEGVADKDLPECTNKERWIKDEKWAVMVPGKTQKEYCIRALDAEHKVEEYLEWRKSKGKEIKEYRIEHRPGMFMRCESYCPVRPWCNQCPLE
jgi:hypothetical protein